MFSSSAQRSCQSILDFFVHGVCPVRKEKALEVLAIIDAARQARVQQDIWFDIPS